MKFFSQVTSPVGRHSWRRTGVACLLACGMNLITVPGAQAAEDTTSPGIDSVIGGDAVVPAVQLTLEARRLPLSEVLAAVKQQSGIEFTVADGTFAREPKLTLAVTAIPLREWMESLTSLYDVVWQPAGPNAFRMQTSGLSETEKSVRHLGTWFNFWNWPSRDGKRPAYLPPRAVPAWKPLVDDNLDLNVITTTGVPLANAPAELQQGVRDTVQREIALRILYDSLLLNVARGPLTLSVARPPGSSSFTLSRSQRNAKSVTVPFPLSVQIMGKNGEEVGKFDFRPSLRGRELFDDRTLFPWTVPTPAGVATLRGQPQDGGKGP